MGNEEDKHMSDNNGENKSGTPPDDEELLAESLSDKSLADFWRCVKGVQTNDGAEPPATISARILDEASKLARRRKEAVRFRFRIACRGGGCRGRFLSPWLLSWCSTWRSAMKTRLCHATSMSPLLHHLSSSFLKKVILPQNSYWAISSLIRP